jgi:Raf kinase inhibitor-like YbhB/YbcL family protein
LTHRYRGGSFLKLKHVVVGCGTCLLFLGALAGCGGGGQNEEQAFQVSSTAFEPNGAIPKKYTGEGQNISPPLMWTGLPEGTKEIALICDDPDAPRAEPFVHWVAYKIPANLTGLPEGSAQGALEGENGAGRTGYIGPMPPEGSGVHHYHFKVYALDTELEAEAGLTKDRLLEAMEGHILADGELIGTYER